MQMQSLPMMGGFVVVLWLLCMAAMAGGCVAMMSSLWRIMRAHESIAESLKKLTERGTIGDTGP